MKLNIKNRHDDKDNATTIKIKKQKSLYLKYDNVTDAFFEEE